MELMNNSIGGIDSEVFSSDLKKNYDELNNKQKSDKQITYCDFLFFQIFSCENDIGLSPLHFTL